MSGSMCFTSTLKIEEEEVMVTKKQGIISILSSDDEINNNKNRKASSLRRTLSADMSSKKWLTQNGFNNISSSSLKKTSSSLNLINQDSSASSPPTQFDVRNTIQQEKQNPNGEKFDIWSSIVSKKVEQQVESESEPALYVHPLVKRSKSSLSEKSLEICTESLGSETGSDGFSSYPASETGDEEEDDDKMMASKNSSVNYVNKVEKKSFPPPIPSLSLRGGEGGPAATLRMKSHRNNGRLVLEAVPVPQQITNFNAQRQGGRLVLTFASQNNHQELVAKMFEEAFDDDSKVVEETEVQTQEFEKDDKQMGCRYVFEEMPKNISGGGRIINVHRLALMVNKPMALPNRNPTIWSNKFNVDQVKSPTTAQSLPPRPPKLVPSQPSSAAKVSGTTTVASLNAYEYYWRPEPMGLQSPVQNFYSNNDKKSTLSKSDGEILKRNKGEYNNIVPSSKGCKEPRRSLVFWEPCYITTS
ncbi:hypothetical protein ACFE04_012382 [Oxalis oulophora]